MSRWIKLLVGVSISLVAVWLAMKDVRLTEVLGALRRADYRGFVLAMALTLLGFWLRALRWRWLISTPRPLGLDSLFSATMIGFMANNLLPLRLGEFVRAWVLGRRERISKTTVFATVVVERVVDMITLLAIFGVALVVHPLTASTEAGRLTRAGAGVLITICAALTVLVVAIEKSPRLTTRVLEWCARVLPERARGGAMATLHRFIEGLGLFSDLPRLAWVLCLSVVMFSVYACCLTVSMWALRIDVPWYGGLVMLVITAIGIMVPAAPGYIGTLNLACVAGLALFSIGKERSVPFSWFYWVSQWLPISLVGLFYLHREGLTLASLSRIGEQPE